MTDPQHDHQMNREQKNETDRKEHRPYWKHAHRDWRFWAALVLMIAAMSIYIMSENFATLFWNRPQTSTSSSGGN
jgi:hypothetical protein